ncbi:hypothetical protein HNP99_001529 [Flavobacterium sp. 28A]|uniref:hypothetical protein n=1 Tax=Flavobacterium sp. 28A TaxID=2735895 RepID=UPI00156ECC77|nr:hypothetical protein [Flavobacterium sp. 28A]NRT15182.1 hypothetical protein [Flavobacterium sp. 28A]
MKKITTALLIILGVTIGYSQENDLPENTGDNFSLEGALALFKKSSSIAEFEKLINEENNNVNNLDLNNDGNVDYITVDDIKDNDTHVIVLSTYLDQNEKQDIATIGIEKTGNEQAILQIEGDTDLYAENTIIEPFETESSMNQVQHGPAIAAINTNRVSVNVWFWPSVRFIYAPRYVAWTSPHHWGFYPKYWSTWHPYRHTIFYAKAAPHRSYFHRVASRRVIVARNVYLPKRRHSTIVIHNNRKTVVIKESKKAKTSKVYKHKRR